MTETQQRFLQAIADRVPPDQIVEVHLFPSIRQGGVETGVAVVASGLGTGDWGLGAPGGGRSGLGDASREEGSATAKRDIVASYLEQAGAADAAAADAGAGESKVDALATDTPSLEADAAAADFPGAMTPSPQSPVPNPQSPSRFTVHAARYRLTLKGVDRGKWEVDVVAEADAPLDAVDAVVRGVQRRAGETADPERLTGDAFRAALAEPAWTLAR